MITSAPTGALAGRRRFWITVTCILLANTAAWLVWHKVFGPKPKDLLRVDSFTPGNNAIVNARPAISWRFNLDVAKDRLGKEPPAVVSPAISGKWIWADSRTLNFEPDADLPRATKIAFKFPGNRLRTADGIVMASEYETAIRTQALRVTGIRQIDWENADQYVIEVKFNDRVLPADALAKLSITGPDGKPVNCRLHGDSAGTAVRVLTDPIPSVFHSALPLVPGADDTPEEPALLVRIKEGLAGTSGPLGLEEPFAQRVPLGRLLIANSVSARVPAEGQPRIVLRFNGTPDLATLRKLVSVEPAANYSVGTEYNSLVLTGDFQYNTRYAVKIAPAPAGADRRKNPRPDTFSVLLPDRQPGLWFEHDYGYLSSEGNRTLLLHTVNVRDLKVSVWRVYDNNLVAWRNTGRDYTWPDVDHYSTPVARQLIPIHGEKNKQQDVRLSLDEILPTGAPRDGVYRVMVDAAAGKDLRLQGAEFDYESHSGLSQSAVVTLSDIGLTAKRTRTGLTVWAVSLRQARPLANVRVRVYSNKNQPLGEAITNYDGLATVANIQPNEGEKPTIVLADLVPPTARDRSVAMPTTRPIAKPLADDAQEQKPLFDDMPWVPLLPFTHALQMDDGTGRQAASGTNPTSGAGLTWLDIRAGEWELSETDISGRPYLREGYEAFVYTDRGVYRPGETVYFHAIVRGPDYSTPKPFPVQWQLRRPDLHDYRSFMASLDNDGAVSLELKLPDDLPTGRWTAHIGLPGQAKTSASHFGQVAFQVEEYVPDRLKVSLKLGNKEDNGVGDAPLLRYRISDKPLPAQVQADYLFGRPAEGLNVQFNARLDAIGFSPKGWSGWTFGDSAELVELPGDSAVGAIMAKLLNKDGEEDAITLDEKGHAAWDMDLKKLLSPDAPVMTRNGKKHPETLAATRYMGPWRLSVSAGVQEVGGRTITASQQADVDLLPFYVGVRASRTATARPGTPFDFDLALVNADGKCDTSRLATLSPSILLETWNTTLVHGDGRYRYDSTRVLEDVKGDVAPSSIRVKDGRATLTVNIPDAGCYVLRLRDKFSGAMTSLRFYVTGTGGWEDNVSRENPERLEVAILPAGATTQPALDPHATDQYILQAGDNLFRVSMKLYGETAFEQLHAMYELNRELLKHAAALKPGTKLRLPQRVMPPAPVGKSTLRPGDTAQVLVRSPFAGRLLLSVETDEVVSTRVVEMPTSQLSIPIEIADAWRPNAYVTATVVRAIDPNIKWRTHRAFGAARLNLDPREQRLDVQLNSPTDIRPRAQLPVNVRITDSHGQPVRNAAVTLAAVDEGILSLTRFKTPNPLAFFTASRALGVSTADLYSVLMPEVAKPDKTSSVGGDESASSLRRQSPVRSKRIKPVSLFSGVLHTDENGVAGTNFAVPEFTGALRVMAVGYSGASFGSTEKGTLVRSPLLVQSSFPRFAAPGDQFEVPLLVFNNGSTAGTVKMTVQLLGEAGPCPLKFAAIDAPKLALDPTNVPAGAQHITKFTVLAKDLCGIAKIRITAAMGDETYEENLELPVRPPSPAISAGGYATATTTRPTRLSIPAGLLAGSETLDVTVTPWPSLQLPEGLDYLERYPYGCAEQTISTCFPLIYLGDVGKHIAPGVFAQNRVGDKVQAGIIRLIGMQTSEGGIAMWPGSRETWPWASLYAAHFVAEAEAAGHRVPEDFRKHLLTYARNLLDRSGDDADLYELQAYASYVLALAGQPPRSAMNRLTEVVSGPGRLGLSQSAPQRAQARLWLSLAWNSAGRRDLAQKLIPDSPPLPRRDRQTGGNIGSPIRDRALLINAMLANKADDPALPALVQQLADTGRKKEWRSTQDVAFAMMAIGKYLRQNQPKQPYQTAEIWLGDKRLASADGGSAVSLRMGNQAGMPGQPTLDLKDLEIRLSGDAAAIGYVTWLQSGVPVAPPADQDSGMKIRRTYLKQDGAPIKDQTVRSGDLVKIELSIEAPPGTENIVIEDLLPAGLEIANARLATAAKIEQVSNAPNYDPKAPAQFYASKLEMRDDRLVLVGRMPNAAVAKYTYLARAVSPGKFVAPPVRAECMYDLSVNGISGSGTLIVKPGK